MCRCPDGSFANMIGGRIVCPSYGGTGYANPPPPPACPPGTYKSRAGCIRVGQFLCPNGRHSCPQGDTCTPTGCMAQGASACPQNPSRFCNAPLTCATNLQGKDTCLSEAQIESLIVEKQTRDIIKTIDTRDTRLQEINRAFEQQNGMSYGAKLEQQKAAAFKQEKNWPAAKQAQLEKARHGTLDQLEKYAANLKKAAPQEAAYEAPLRVALNPDLSNPAKWSRLSPSSAPKQMQPTATPPASPDPYQSDSTFTPLTRDAWLRQQLAAEHAHAKAIDDQRARLLLAEIPLRATVVAGSAAADRLHVGPLYDVITAAPAVYMGQTSPATAAGKVTGSYIGSKFLENTGLPPGLNTASKAVDQTVDWLVQYRRFEATRTR